MSEATPPDGGSTSGPGTSGAGTQAAADPHLAPSARHPGRVSVIVDLCFVLSFLAIVALAVTFSVGGQTQLEATFIGVSLGSMGVGLTAWAKYLMPKGPFVEGRHFEGRSHLASDEEDRQAFAGAFGRGAVLAGRRKFLLKALGLAGGAVGVVALFPLRSLGPQPKDTLFHTSWKPGTRMVRVDGKPVNVADIDVGGLITVFPEGGQDDPQIQESDQVLLLRVASSPIVTKPGRETWSPDGYLAYSKVCTHAGCPVSLYEAQTQQLLCPCHQSLFDVLDGADPIFGPAPRPLPQLAIYADSNGFLRSQHDFLEAVGPGFWERGASDGGPPGKGTSAQGAPATGGPAKGGPAKGIPVRGVKA